MITNHEWLTRNELRSYPVREDAPVVSLKGWELDPSLIVDLMIVGDHAPTDVCLQSITVTPSICSVVLGDATTGESLASATAVIGSELDVDLIPLIDGIGGSLSFGKGLMPDRYLEVPRGIHEFGAETLIESRCVLLCGAMPVSGLVSPSGESIIRGDIVVSLGQSLDAQIVRSEQDGDPFDQVTLSLKNLSDFISPCEEKSSPCECAGVPISTINGVPGNESGIITIEIEDENGSIYLVGPHVIALLLTAVQNSLCQELEEPDVWGRIKGASGQYSDDVLPITPYNSPEDTTFPLPAE